jgi:hypothetical protein
VEALDALVRPLLDERLRPAVAGWTLALEGLEGLPPGALKALLRLALADRLALAPGGLRRPHLDALAALVAAGAGARVRLPGGVLVERERGSLWVGRAGAPWPRLALPREAEVEVPGTHLRLRVERVGGEPGPPRAGPGPGRGPGPWPGPWEIWLDAAAVPGPLAVRPWRPGDRLVPFGEAEPVRVGRLLGGAGVPRVLRAAGLSSWGGDRARRRCCGWSGSAGGRRRPSRPAPRRSCGSGWRSGPRRGRRPGRGESRGPRRAVRRPGADRGPGRDAEGPHAARLA